MNRPKSRRLPLKGDRTAAARTRRPRRRQLPAQAYAAAPGFGFSLARGLKTLLGLALLPVCWVLTAAMFENFARANAGGRRFWATEGFYFFALGALLWLIVFFGLPRPSVLALRLRLYVFGHELTHALWVWARGGRVSAFRVGRDGGYIVADRNSVLISLAPYFFPLFSLLVVAVWGLAGVWWPAVWGETGRRVLFALVGATWAFHFSFTCWMIPKDQPDLRLHGTFFSLVVIYLANVLVLAALFLVACPDVTWAGFGADVARHAERLVESARQAVNHLAPWPRK